MTIVSDAISGTASFADTVSGGALSSVGNTLSSAKGAYDDIKALVDNPAEFCMVKMVEKIGMNSLSPYVPYLVFFIELITDRPKQTGFQITDEQMWIEYVDKQVLKFKTKFNIANLTTYFTNPDVVQTLENFTGEDMSFLQSEEQIMTMLYNSKSVGGLMEKFLTFPVDTFRDHSISLEDRFGYYLPLWFEKLNVKPALRLVGDATTQPQLSLKKLRIINFVLYDNDNYQPAILTENVFEKFVGRPKGDDGTTYNYFGPNNAVPNGLPVDLVDLGGLIHDLGYSSAGYNSDGSVIVDKELVDFLQKNIDNGRIKKGTQQYKNALGGIYYFSLIQIR